MTREPLTDDLLKQLLDAQDVDTFVDGHANTPINLSYYLADLLERTGARKSDVIIIFRLVHGHTLAETEHGLQRLGGQGIDHGIMRTRSVQCICR